jgi:thiamine-monophosphate kinase
VNIAELGEFGLINLIGETIGKSLSGGKNSGQLICGIGDDAAAWQMQAAVQMATVDSLIQGVHFTFDTISWEELGWKSLAVNLSDIAAMGGQARYAMVSLSLPGETEVSEVLSFYRGMLDLAEKTGVALVGGDTCRSPLVTISVTVIGDAAEGDNMLRRSGAKPGDLVAVTGYLGSAAAGLLMLQENLKLDAGLASYIGEAFRRPCPRLAEGRLLLDLGASAAIDISDGLVIDLGHIAGMSRVGTRIEVERVPIDPRVRESFGKKALSLALSGGEDYELLFTASHDTISRLKMAVALPVTVVGEIISEGVGLVSVVDGRGKPLSLPGTGWEHFTA